MTAVSTVNGNRLARTPAPPAPLVFAHQSLCTRVVSRPGAVRELGAELVKLGCKRPVLLSGTRTAGTALYGNARETLRELSFIECGGIPPHSSVEAVSTVAARAREHDADAFVAIGGGSVVDTAKAAALVLAEGEPLAQHASRFEPPDTVITPPLLRRKLPIVAIPTTASGAEATGSVGVRAADGSKLLFSDVQLASRVILLDPVANLEIPAEVLLPTAMNGLAHCIEGLYSRSRSPITDELALGGIPLFERAMRRVASAPQNAEARAELMVAAQIGGMVLASARSCLHHALCHVLGATYGVPHGAANSVMLPYSLRFNAGIAAAELAAAARRLDIAQTPAAAPEALVDWICALQDATGVPTRLRDLGIDRDGLKAVAAKAIHERGIAYNPRPVRDPSELEQLLLAAW